MLYCWKRKYCTTHEPNSCSLHHYRNQVLSHLNLYYHCMHWNHVDSPKHNTIRWKQWFIGAICTWFPPVSGSLYCYLLVRRLLRSVRCKTWLTPYRSNISVYLYSGCSCACFVLLLFGSWWTVWVDVLIVLLVSIFILIYQQIFICDSKSFVGSLISQYQGLTLLDDQSCPKFLNMRIYRLNKYWALSSFGRAPSLHLGGERFDPLGSTEQRKTALLRFFLCARGKVEVTSWVVVASQGRENS